MAERFCKICRGWHDLDQPWPDECQNHYNDNRSSLSAPMVISDSMKPVQSMLDGRMYDSKSRLRRTYKQAGVVELGNDAPLTNKPPPKPDKSKIKASVDKAFSRAGLGA